jgi:hypothetical protein
MKDDNQKIINEIEGYLKQLDRENLLFIKEQASVLVYNKEIQERNARLKETQKSDGKKPSEKKKSPSESHAAVYIEQLKNAKFFNLCINDAKLFMDRQEISAVFKIAHHAETPEKGAMRLYNWFKKERKDVLVEGHITHGEHPHLFSIYKELLDTFTI